MFLSPSSARREPARYAVRPREIEAAFLRELGRLGLDRPGTRLLVACSGGPDSTALLCLSSEAARRKGLEVAAGHVDHKARGRESRGDRLFVRSLSRRLGVPCLEREARVRAGPRRRKVGFEAAARELRYRALQVMARSAGARAILTGHTLEDQSETVLLRLLRGTGPAGLSGIWELGRLPQGRIPVARPLLGLQRADLRRYLAARGQSFRSDRSNRSTRFLRNWVRHRALPLLRRRSPGLDRHLARLAEIFRGEERLWRALEPRLDLGGLLRYPIAVQRRLLRRFLQDRPRYEDVESLRTCLTAVPSPPPNSRSLKAPRAFPDVRRAAVRLRFPGENRKLPGGWSLGGRLVRGRPRRLDQGPWTACLDWGRVAGGRWGWRRWRAGDRFRPLGSPGRRKLSDFFGDAGIPSASRAGVPVVTVNGRPAWVVGFQIEEAFKVLPRTERTLVLKADFPT